MLHNIGHVPSLLMLEVPYRSMGKERSSVQHHGGVLGLNLGLAITPPLHDGFFTRGPCLHCPSYFDPFLGLGFFGGKTISFFHHLLTLLVLFPLLICEAKLGNLGKGRGGRLDLDCRLGHIASYIGL